MESKEKATSAPMAGIAQSTDGAGGISAPHVERPLGQHSRPAYTRLKASRKEVDLACHMSAEGVDISSIASILNHAWNTDTSLSIGFLLFAGDHRQRLPGNFYDYTYTGSEAYKNDWLAGDAPRAKDAGYFSDWDQIPNSGTIFPYVDEQLALYRCPALQEGRNRSGKSNGKFDYTVPGSWTGAPLTTIPVTSRLRITTTEYIEGLPTPMIVEEHPWKGTSAINMTSKNGYFGEPGLLAEQHYFGANYASITGAVQWFDPMETDGADWSAKAPSGTMRGIAASYCKWGYWKGM